MPAPPPAPDQPVAPTESARAAAVEELHAAFARLRPQGTDRWNFLGAFNQLADRYGPDHPGVSALADALGGPARPPSRRDRLARLAGRGSAAAGAADESALAEALAMVVEALRWMGARVTALEDRLEHEDRPLDGAPWLVPAVDLGPWCAPLAERLTTGRPGGEVLVGDCGAGELLEVLAQGGVRAEGAEPRGLLALRALEAGHRVTMGEVDVALGRHGPGSLGGLVLSGVVDRRPLHALVGLLGAARAVLAAGAPLLVVARGGPGAAGAAPGTEVARDLSPPSLHAATWMTLLERAGFVRAELLRGISDPDGRLALAASVPP